jgi:hypothetical protein
MRPGFVSAHSYREVTRPGPVDHRSQRNARGPLDTHRRSGAKALIQMTRGMAPPARYLTDRGWNLNAPPIAGFPRTRTPCPSVSADKYSGPTYAGAHSLTCTAVPTILSSDYSVDETESDRLLCTYQSCH